MSKVQVFGWRDAPRATFAVLGDPISHTWSPLIQSAALADLGRPEQYVALHVPLEEFTEAVEHLRSIGYLGVNCTLPLKEVAFQWCEALEAHAHELGVVNTLNLPLRMGTNTDTLGFLETLRELEIKPPGPILLLGAGGTARSLIRTLANEGFDLRVYNRTPERAEQLLEELELSFPVVQQPVVGDNVMILNTTSAGLSGSAIDVAWGKPPRGTVAYDVVYRQELTPFLADAKLAGCRVIDGRAMLVAQGALALEWWLKVPVSREVMNRALP
jgi:shikimate dehydrogenase